MLWLIFSLTFTALSLIILHARLSAGKVNDEEILKVLTACVAFTWLSPVLFVWPGTNSTPVSFGEGKVSVHKFGTVSIPIVHRTQQIPSGKALPLSGSVTAVTENPKVRTVSYTLQIKITDPAKYFTGKQRLSEGNIFTRRVGTFFRAGDMKPRSLNKSTQEDDFIGADAMQIAATLMYEFNSTHSKRLSKFSNPGNQQQQENFKELVEGWINREPQMVENGLEVEVQRFSLK